MKHRWKVSFRTSRGKYGARYFYFRSRAYRFYSEIQMEGGTATVTPA